MLAMEGNSELLKPLVSGDAATLQETFDRRRLLFEKADGELRTVERGLQRMQDVVAGILAARAPAGARVEAGADPRNQGVPQMTPFPSVAGRHALKPTRGNDRIARAPWWAWLVPVAAVVAWRMLCWIFLRAAAYQALHITVHSMRAGDGGSPTWPQEFPAVGQGFVLASQAWVLVLVPVVNILVWCVCALKLRDLQSWTTMCLCVVCMDLGSALFRVVAVLPLDTAIQDCQAILGSDFLSDVPQPLATGTGVDLGAVWSIAWAPGAACLNEVYSQLPLHSPLFALGLVDMARRAKRADPVLFVTGIACGCIALQLLELVTRLRWHPQQAVCDVFAIPMAILCYSNVIVAFVARHWARGSPKDGLASLETLDNGCYFEVCPDTLQPGGDLQAPCCFVPFCCFAGAEHHLMSLRGTLPASAGQEQSGKRSVATHTDAVPPHRRVTVSMSKRLRLNGETRAQMRHAAKIVEDAVPTSPVNKRWVREVGPEADFKDGFVFVTTVLWLFAKVLLLGLPVALASLPPIGSAWLFAVVEAQNSQGLHHVEFSLAFVITILLSMPLLAMALVSLLLDVGLYYLLSVLYCTCSCRWRAMLRGQEVLAPFKHGPSIIWHLPDLFKALAGQCWRHGWPAMLHMVTCTVLFVPFVKYYVNCNPWIYDLKLRKNEQCSEELRSGPPTQLAGICCDMLSSPRLPAPMELGERCKLLMRTYAYMAPFYPRPSLDRRWSLGMQVGGRRYPGRAMLVSHTTHGRSENGGSTEQFAVSSACEAPVYRIMFWYSNPYHLMTGWSELTVSSATPGAPRVGEYRLEHTTLLVSGLTKQTGDRGSWAGTGATLSVAEAWAKTFMAAFSVWPSAHAAPKSDCP